MCLFKLKVEHEDEEEITEAPRRIVVRPISPAQISQRNSTILVARSPSHSRHSPRTSATRIIVEPPQSRPTVEYITGGGGQARAGPRASIPRIIHAQPSPEGGSPRGSRVSVRSSSRSPHRHSSRGSRTSVTYVERDVVELITNGTRERPRSGHFLTPTSSRPGELIDPYGRVDTPRATALYLDENQGRIRSRSITYATTGPKLSRERIVVEEGGRRKETYRTLGSV